jgi:hypothetical protein
MLNFILPILMSLDTTPIIPIRVLLPQQIKTTMTKETIKETLKIYAADTVGTKPKEKPKKK